MKGLGAITICWDICLTPVSLSFLPDRVIPLVICLGDLGGPHLSELLLNPHLVLAVTLYAGAANALQSGKSSKKSSCAGRRRSFQSLRASAQRVSTIVKIKHINASGFVKDIKIARVLLTLQTRIGLSVEQKTKCSPSFENEIDVILWLSRASRKHRPPELLVKWKGGEETWEPYENMAETEALDEYERLHGQVGVNIV